jgi:hypothetical protein
MSTSHSVLLGTLLSLTVMSSAVFADNPPSVDPATVTTTPTATTTPATPPPSGASQTAPTQAGDDKKKICRKAPPPIGTRIGARKVCRTAADWRRQEAVANETTSEIQRRKGWQGL